MDHRAVILDGITVQHVGEVLFDSPTTASIRTGCRRTYLRSLEDFGISDDLHVTFPDGGDTWFVWDTGSYDEVDEDDERLGEDNPGFSPAGDP